MTKILFTSLIAILLYVSNCLSIYGDMNDFLKETKGLKTDPVKLIKLKKPNNIFKESTRARIKGQINTYLKDMKNGWSQKYPWI